MRELRFRVRQMAEIVDKSSMHTYTSVENVEGAFVISIIKSKSAFLYLLSNRSEEVKLLRDPLPKLKLPCLLAQVHEELGNLVSVHARSRYLDGSCPVEVVVTEVEGKLLYH
jgi:hypothetical protein